MTAMAHTGSVNDLPVNDLLDKDVFFDYDLNH